MMTCQVVKRSFYYLAGPVIQSCDRINSTGPLAAATSLREILASLLLDQERTAFPDQQQNYSAEPDRQRIRDEGAVWPVQFRPG